MYLIASLVLAICAYYCYKIVQLYKARERLAHIPQAPLDNFFKGHLLTINAYKARNAFMDLFVEWTAAHGQTIVFWSSQVSFVHISDPQILHSIATDVTRFTKAVNLPNRTLYGQKLIGWNSILSGSGIRWAVKRKVMTKFFAKNNMRNLFETCRVHAEGAILDQWRSTIKTGKRIDFHSDIAVSFLSYLKAFGLHEFYPAERIADNVSKILNAIPKRVTDKWWYMVSDEKVKMCKLVQEMRADLTTIVLQKVEQRKWSDEEPTSDDLLGLLIQANATTDGVTPNERDLVVENVVDDLMTVCLVFDNMVKQLSSLFTFLDKVPDVQSKMMSELRSTEINSIRDLERLTYTEKCILEAMRIGPALLRGARVIVPNDGKLGTYDWPVQMTRIIYSEYVMHMDPSVWPNPTEFNPERWSGDFTSPPFSYVPFWTGSRGCLAKHFAMMLMKMTLSVLCKNFEITQAFDEKNPPVIDQTYAVMRLTSTIDMDVRPL